MKLGPFQGSHCASKSYDFVKQFEGNHCQIVSNTSVLSLKATCQHPSVCSNAGVR